MNKKELAILKEHAKTENLDFLLWLVEQAEKVEKLEEKIEMQNYKISNYRKKLNKIMGIVNTK